MGCEYSAIAVVPPGKVGGLAPWAGFALRVILGIDRDRLAAGAKGQAMSRSRSGIVRKAMVVLAASVVLTVAFVAASSAARTGLPLCSTTVPYTRTQLNAASKTVRSLFPSVTSVGFAYRTDHGPQARRHPYWPGWCGSWSVEYADQPPRGHHGYVRGYVDVSVTIYRKPAQALAALQEAAYGAPTVLANGATLREAGDGGGIESVIRNVFIGTVSSYPYVNGLPDHTQGPIFGAAVQMTIHRRIQTAVLGSR